MVELVVGGVGLVLALVFGLLARRERQRGARASAELAAANEALGEALQAADALARPLDGAGALRVLERLRDE